MTSSQLSTLSGMSHDGTHTSEQRQKTLYNQQQRLLFLRHGSKCKHVDGKCPQNLPNCENMKDLWLHIKECRVPRCKYPRCISSRYVLSHYHKCKDEQCIVCGPVRKIIRFSRPHPSHTNNHIKGGSVYPGMYGWIATPQGLRPAPPNYQGPLKFPAGTTVAQIKHIHSLHKAMRKTRFENNA